MKIPEKALKNAYEVASSIGVPMETAILLAVGTWNDYLTKNPKTKEFIFQIIKEMEE